MLTNIEDLILRICDPFTALDHSRIVPRDKGVLFSFAAQLRKGLAFTERQAELALKILDRNRDSYAVVENFTNLLQNPIFKNPFRIVDTAKTISIARVDNNEFIAVKYPFNHKTNNALSFISKKTYDKNLKALLISLNENNIVRLVEFGRGDFDIDSRLLDYYKKIKDIQNNPENYVPCIDWNNTVELKNTTNSMEKFFAANMNGSDLHDMLLSKLMGLYLTNAAKSHVTNSSIHPLTKSIILEKHRRFAIKNYNNIDICNFLSEVDTWPVLLVMNDDKSSTTILNQWTHSLTAAGVDRRHISVLFRSQTDRLFNEFVKNNSLNNLVTEETKVVVIKYKTPKILYKIDFRPKIVISTSAFYAHFTNQRIIDYHPLVMYYTDQNHPTGTKIAKL